MKQLLIVNNFIFQAKVDEENQQQKTLEKPDLGIDLLVNTGSAFTYLVHEQNEDMIETVPPAVAEKYPVVVGGEDKDPIMRERRNKVREVYKYSLTKFILNI